MVRLRGLGGVWYAPRMAKPYAKPAHIRALEGDTSKPESIEAVGDLAQPPAWMGKSAKAIWAEALASAPAGLLKQLDASVFSVWVMAHDLFVRSAKESQKTPVIGKTPNGYPLVNPCHIVMKQQAELMMRAAQQLGFTPTARARIPDPFAAKDPPETQKRPSTTTAPTSPAEPPSDNADSPSAQRILWGARGRSPSSSSH